MTPTLDRIKESFARELESLGVTSLDTWRHNALKAAVDKLVEQIAAEVSPALEPVQSESEPVAADPTEGASSSSETAPSSDPAATSDGSSHPQPTESEQTNG